MDLMHIPLSELSIAKTNVRQGVKKADCVSACNFDPLGG